MIAIVTDSTCDLPGDQLAGLGVTVEPINIIFGTQEYREGATLAPREFYRMVAELEMIPKTSQPAPAQFAATYGKLAEAGATAILSLHITGELSGTVQSALLGADMVKDTVDVRVFDSRSGSAGMGFMVLEACELLRQGAGVDEILQRWRQMRDSLRIFFYLDTLKYARMSGRVGAMQSALASLLNIKPLVRLDDGALNVFERIRTRKAALNRLLEILETEMGRIPLHLAVVHAEDPTGARRLMEEAKRRFDCRHTFTTDLATSVAAHLGIGTLGLVAYPAEQ